jgi:serine/threonine-protein kinase RsbW
MRQKQFELEVEARVENIPVIADFVSNALEQFGADTASTNEVQLVIDEACTNVIKHAYAGVVGPLKLVLEMTGDDLIIVLNDKGKPFDPRSVPPPDLGTDVETRRIGGLGMYFMEKLTDEITYSFDARLGNRLTMKKRLLPKADDG